MPSALTETEHGEQFGGFVTSLRARLLTSLRAHGGAGRQCGRMWSRGNVGECWRLLLKSEKNPLTRSINEIYGTHPTREALSRICGYDIGAPVNSNDRGITKGYIVTHSRTHHNAPELLQGKHSTRGAGGAQRATSRATESAGTEPQQRIKAAHLHNDSEAEPRSSKRYRGG